MSFYCLPCLIFHIHPVHMSIMVIIKTQISLLANLKQKSPSPYRDEKLNTFVYHPGWPTNNIVPLIKSTGINPIPPPL